MSSNLMALHDAADVLALFAQEEDQFAFCSLPEAVERAAVTTRAFLAAETEASAEMAALCGSLTPEQLSPATVRALQALCLALEESIAGTRQLLLVIEELAEQTRHLPHATESDVALAKQLVETASRYGSGAAPNGEHMRVMAALEAMPAAVAAALEIQDQERSRGAAVEAGVS